MSFEAPPVQEQDKLPEIRQVSLEKLSRIPHPNKAKKIERELPSLGISFGKKGLIVKIIVLLILSGIIVFQIYRYQDLTKKWIALVNERNEKVNLLKTNLKAEEEFAKNAVAEKKAVQGNFLKMKSEFALVKHRFAIYTFAYRKLLASYYSNIAYFQNIVANMQVWTEGLRTYNAKLNEEIESRENSIEEMTGKLMENMARQEELIKENVQLKEDYRKLESAYNMIISAQSETQETKGAKNAGK